VYRIAPHSLARAAWNFWLIPDAGPGNRALSGAWVVVVTEGSMGRVAVALDGAGESRVKYVAQVFDCPAGLDSYTENTFPWL
jgi:hypothetical protein